ncbi:MAG: hypothetical protein KA793_08795 [Bacteroidales bacterium]|nr:hypothetical protein [Bacteroidales bacterium]
MKHLFVILVAAILVSACCNNKKTDDKCCDGNDTTKTSCKCPENMVNLDSLLLNPDSFVDKEISACGIATHVCEHSGKNLFVAVNEDDENYLVAKATDSLGTFDKTLAGKHVMVSGTFRKTEEESVETHHEKDVFYYLETSKVAECKCSGKNEGCCKGKEGKSCCAGHDEKAGGCKGHADKKEGCKH